MLPLRNKKEQTANFAWMFSSTTKPIAIIWLYIPFQPGIFNVRRPGWWVYVRSSGHSNGWSQATIHSANSISNLVWSHLS
jgi:hypothetical protein